MQMEMMPSNGSSFCHVRKSFATTFTPGIFRAFTSFAIAVERVMPTASFALRVVARYSRHAPQPHPMSRMRFSGVTLAKSERMRSLLSCAASSDWSQDS